MNYHILNFNDFVSELNHIYYVANSQTLKTSNEYTVWKLKQLYYINNFVYRKVNLNLLTDKEIANIKYPTNSLFYIYVPESIINPDTKTQLRLESFVQNLESQGQKIIRNIADVASKKNTHEILAGNEWMVKACFDVNQIDDVLGWPMVAKKDFLHSGLGIKKYKSKKDLLSSGINYDLFTEFIDYKYEFRSIFHENDLIYISQRIPKLETKIDINTKGQNDTMDFVYVAQDISKLEFRDEIAEIGKYCRKQFENLEIFSIDFFITKDKKIKVIELNTMSGLDPYRRLMLYEFLYAKTFNMQLSYQRKALIEDLRNIFLNSEYKSFKKEIDSSVAPVNYNIPDSKINKNLLRQIEDVGIKDKRKELIEFKKDNDNFTI